MPLFKFKVSTSAGQVQEILIEGESQSVATKRVVSRGLTPIKFLGESDGVAQTTAAGGQWFRRKFDVVEFTERLVPLLEADIPLEKSLAIIEETAESEEDRELLADMRRGLHSGRRFSKLIKDRGRMFPKMYSSIVEAGEESGALPQELAQLRHFLLMMREMKSFMISSMVYPIFVMIVCMVVIMVLLGWVVPKFAMVIGGMGREPAAITQALFTVSDIFRDYWWAIPVMIIAGAIFFVWVQRDPGMKRRWDAFILKVPMIGHLVLMANIGRLIRTMAILMRSGVHILSTVSISARVLTNHTLEESVSGLAAELRRGERLSAGLGRSKFIPPLVIRMLAVGEETGMPAEMLEKVADRYDEELKQLIKRLLAWFEPIVIVTLGGIVGTIVLALFLTVINMNSMF